MKNESCICTPIFVILYPLFKLLIPKIIQRYMTFLNYLAKTKLQLCY